MKDNRANYWNEEYFEYWKDRVSEANKHEGLSKVVSGDQPLPDDIIYIDAVAQLQVDKDHVVLELGCGYGRSLPFLSGLCRKLYAVDISQSMIDGAKEMCQSFDNINYLVSAAENIKVESGEVDHISCFAVFDALYQKDALIEINRLLTVGGKILLTGKNDNYMDDDKAALDAEVGARGKSHPNYFTDFCGLVSQLANFGFKLNLQKYFIRRGDFAKSESVEQMPAQFYEYLVVLEKIGPVVDVTNIAVASDYSKTFKRAQ
jgi:ubiquinone/menaquinone biosynthesis C-methylase UbiE